MSRYVIIGCQKTIHFRNKIFKQLLKRLVLERSFLSFSICISKYSCLWSFTCQLNWRFKFYINITHCCFNPEVPKRNYPKKQQLKWYASRQQRTTEIYEYIKTFNWFSRNIFVTSIWENWIESIDLLSTSFNIIISSNVQLFSLNTVT